MVSAAPLDPAASALEENVQDHLSARYIAIAGLTLIIWTHLTTLDEESRYIWKNDAGMTLNKALFGAVRYFTTFAFACHCLTLFLPRPSFELCRGIIISVGAAALGLIGACDLILLLRTWAIYDRTRESLICLGILLAITHLPTLVLGALWMTTLSIGPSKLYPVIPGCSLESTATEEFWRVIIPSVVYNTALSGASMYKIWSYHRTRINTPLISLLVRDGMAYYVIILIAYLCNAFFLFRKRLVIITIEGRFITWVVAVTCAQLQLNLRTAVYHVPGYVTTYYQQQAAIQGLTGRVDTPHRPGVDTLIFGGTATELAGKYHHSSLESEGEQEERHYSLAIELVTTSVHVSRRSTGKKRKTIAPSADFGTGKQAPPLPQRRRVNSFQGSPSRSPWQSVESAANPHATTEEAFPLSPTSIAHSEPSNRSVSRANTPSAKTNRAALGFDSNHSWALARPTTSSSSTALPSSKLKKQHRDPSQVKVPLHDHDHGHDHDHDHVGQDSVTARLGIPTGTGTLRGDSPPSALDATMQVEVQVECEHDESGVSPAPRLSEYEESAKRSASRDGGIVATRVGVWR